MLRIGSQRPSGPAGEVSEHPCPTAGRRRPLLCTPVSSRRGRSPGPLPGIWDRTGNVANVAQRGGKAPSLPGERGGSENLCSEVQGGAGTAGLSPRPGVAARGAGRGRPWLASEILLVSPL